MTTTALSARERQVLRGIAEDLTYPQIGRRLGLSAETVKVYARRLRRKLRKTTKVGLALWAASNPESARVDAP